MKNYYFLLVALLVFIGITEAQTPQKFNYQVVVRDTDGNPLANQTVTLRISLVQGSASGTPVYVEIHSKTTNSFGLVTLAVGEGTLVSGVFENISWGINDYYIKTELDATGGTSFTLFGTSQLLSVPYSLYSENTANNDDADADPANEIQNLSSTKNGNEVTLGITGGTGTTLDVSDADADPANELQTISKAGQTITLSNGGGSFTDEVNDADANPANELQTLTQNGLSVTLSQGGGTINVADNDNDPANELQQVSKAGSVVSLSQNGGSFSVDDADANPTNEIQNLSNTKNGNEVTLAITGGTGTTLDVSDADADLANELQTISKAGQTVTLSNGGGSFTDEVNDADADPENELQTVSRAGDVVILSQEGGFFSVNDADADPDNELQNLWSFKDGNVVTLDIDWGTGTTIDVSDADADPENELQTLSRAGDVVILSQEGGFFSVNDADADPDNELQNLWSFKDGNVVTLDIDWGTGTTIDVSDADADPANEIQTVTETNNQVTLSQGGGSFMTGVKSYTQSEIDAMTPYNGLTVHNATTNCINYYFIDNWFETCGTCTPQPTTASAGSDQYITSNSLTTTLAANYPVQGTGVWAIVNGEGGTIENATNPSSSFTGQPCTSYTLAWKITTSCASSMDMVEINFMETPTVANAGNDTIVGEVVPSVVLFANTPVTGQGMWTIISGEGGTLVNPTNASALFSGNIGVNYTLQWEISTMCSTSTDYINITFANIQIGQPYQGGIIAYILQPGDPGYIEGRTQGIIAAPNDQSTASSWGCYGTTIPGADGTALGTGYQNTLEIVAGCTENGIPALICSDMELNGYSDWYLPSRDELNKLYLNKNAIGGFHSSYAYWSSSEASPQAALIQGFGGGYQSQNSKMFSYIRTRAIRSFGSCTPQPTVASAGSDQYFTGNTVTTTLSANTALHGTGFWTILSGAGGIITDPANPTSSFTGQPCTSYTLEWTITNTCGSTIDLVKINFVETPTVANAGNDTIVGEVVPTVVLYANTPESGQGMWTIMSGDGGTLVDPTNAATQFSGSIGVTYTLRWQISTSCLTSTDYIDVTFANMQIGQPYQGGIIAYILQPGDPGYSAYKTHGIIAAPSNQSTASSWGCYGTAIPGADGTALGTGYQNTLEIVAGCSESGITARICNDLELNGYTDWYLPSIDELYKLYLNKDAIGGFDSMYAYWSSSEASPQSVMTLGFGSGYQNYNSKIFSYVRTRAIRSF